MKKISINTPELPIGITHDNTTWNIYDVLDNIVETETNNPLSILSYAITSPMDASSYFTAEAILHLSDGTDITTTKVKITKDTYLVTDTVAMPPVVKFEIRKNGKYRLSIDEPVLVGGVDDWVSTDWLVTTSAGVVLYQLNDSNANKTSVEIPDSVLSEYDFVVFKARYNLRQNTESKYGVYGYVRKHSDTEFILDQVKLYVGETNTYRLMHTKPASYLFNYEVIINGYVVKEGIISPEVSIIIPAEYTVNVDSAYIEVTDKNFSGTYKKRFELHVIEDPSYQLGKSYTSGKKEVTSNVINVSDVLSSLSGEIAVSPIYRNAQALISQNGKSVYDNTFRCTYYDVATGTLSVMKVGSAIEKLSNRLIIFTDVIDNFSTYFIKHNRVAFYYTDNTGQGKLKIFDISDNYAELLSEEIINPTSTISSYGGKLYWLEGNELKIYSTSSFTTHIMPFTLLPSEVFVMKDDTTALYFDLNGNVRSVDITNDIVTNSSFSNQVVNVLQVINLSGTIIIIYELNGDLFFSTFEDSLVTFKTIRNLSISETLLLTDQYNKHITIVKG